MQREAEIPLQKNTYGDRALDREFDALIARVRALEGSQSRAQAAQPVQPTPTSLTQNLSFSELSVGDLFISGNFSQTSSSKKVGFFGATPVVRTSAYTLTYSTGSRTNSAPTAINVSTTASTQTTPFGYTTQAQADAIPVAINALITDVLNLKQVLTQTIKDLQSYGLLQ